MVHSDWCGRWICKERDVKIVSPSISRHGFILAFSCVYSNWAFLHKGRRVYLQYFFPWLFRIRESSQVSCATVGGKTKGGRLIFTFLTVRMLSTENGGGYTVLKKQRIGILTQDIKWINRDFICSKICVFTSYILEGILPLIGTVIWNFVAWLSKITTKERRGVLCNRTQLSIVM